MALPPLPLDQLRDAAAAQLPGAIVVLAGGTDADESFDVAAGADARLADADPANLTVQAEHLSADQAAAAALAWLATDPEPGALAAFGIVSRSAHTRTTRRARLTGVALEPDMSAAGRWVLPAGDFSDALTASYDEAPADGEVLEFVEIKRRGSYKVDAKANKVDADGNNLAATNEFIVVAGDRIVSRGHAKRVDAKRAAQAMLKEMSKDDHDLPQLELFKLSGKGGGPLDWLRRVRRSQTITVKAVYATVKPGRAAEKTIGWVLAHVPDAD